MRVGQVLEHSVKTSNFSRRRVYTILLAAPELPFPAPVSRGGAAVAPASRLASRDLKRGLGELVVGVQVGGVMVIHGLLQSSVAGPNPSYITHLFAPAGCPARAAAAVPADPESWNEVSGSAESLGLLIQPCTWGCIVVKPGEVCCNPRSRDLRSKPKSRVTHRPSRHPSLGPRFVA
jgi:hypothetical protein